MINITEIGFPNPDAYRNWLRQIKEATCISGSEIYDRVRKIQSNPTVYLTDIAAIQIVAHTLGVKLKN